MAILLVLFGVAGPLWAFYGYYNRPEALMDYVPQEMGIYDTTYRELDELDCRNCHGNSLADRHHLTDTVVVYGLCSPCHDMITEPPFVVIIRDCLTSGCHSWYDLYSNGWHHNTDLSASGNCVACHDPNLVGEITPIVDFATHPPSIVTPTPFGCENCHWGQEGSATGDPDNPGHPSTYDHYNAANQFVGFHEYSKPIFGNFDTHHMGFKGNVALQCYECHALDPSNPDWAPFNPELIRYCERCHTPETLHNIAPHVQNTMGWEAVGFHVPPGNTEIMDVDPTVYRTWDPTGPYRPEITDGFSEEQMCIGCHGEAIFDPPDEGDCTGKQPVITTTLAGIQPRHGPCGSVVTLRGENFGEEQLGGRKVQIKQKGCSEAGCWSKVPVVSWTDTRIEFKIPCVRFSAGNYKVRVKTECGRSNKVTFSLKDWISLRAASPEEGACGEWITLSGDSFGNNRSRILGDGYSGVHRVVDFALEERAYTALEYEDWRDTSIKVRLGDVFEDGIDAHTGHRNFVQDDGSHSCAEEPTIEVCRDLKPSVLAVYVKAVYFGDEDGTGDLSCGDIIFQVVTSDPAYFELNSSSIKAEDPIETENRVESDDSPLSRQDKIWLKQGEDESGCCCFISTALEPILRPMFRP
jgi:hypothetical protein